MSTNADGLRIFLSFDFEDGLPHADLMTQWLGETVGARLYASHKRPSGEEFRAKVERALSECDVLLFLMTPESVSHTNKWCPYEIKAVLKRKNARVISLRMVEDVPAPVDVHLYTYVDLTKGPAEWDRLAAQLRRYSPTTMAEVLRQEEQIWQGYTENVARQESPTDGVSVRFISEPPAVDLQEFQDRQPERDELLKSLRDQTIRFVAVRGNPGSGKTAMIARFAADLRHMTSPGVDFFAYLPTFAHHEVSPGVLLGMLARMADGGEPTGRHQQRLRARDVTWQQSLQDIIAGLAHKSVALVIDNVEQLLDRDGGLADVELRRVVAALTERTDHRITIVLVSSRSVLITGVPRAATRDFDLDDARLSEEDALKVLRAMDPRGLMTRESTRQAHLIRICDATKHHPRALQAVASVLMTNPKLDIPDILNGLELDRPTAKEPAEFLVKWVHDSLTDIDRRVLVALAIFGEPVPDVAVDFLLSAHLEGIQTKPVLEKLRGWRVVRQDRGGYYIPPSPDGKLILERVPRGDPDRDEPESVDWTQIDLALFAAEYFDAVAPKDPRHIDDLAPRFSEVRQLFYAEDYEGALVSLQVLTDTWLYGWGQAHLALPWLLRLRGQLKRTDLEVTNLLLMVWAHLQAGSYAEAVDAADLALESLHEVSDKIAVKLLILAGTAHYEHGQIAAAQTNYSDALDVAKRLGSAESVLDARSGLLMCATESGDFPAAQEHLDVARGVLGQHGSPGGPSVAGQLDLKEAWLRGFQGDHAGFWKCTADARRASRENDRRLEAWTYCAEATLLIDQREFEKAAKCAEHAIELAGSSNDMRLLRESENRLAMSQLCLGRLEQAWSAATFAAKIVQRHGALAAFTLKGLIALRREDFDEARTALDRAFRLASQYVHVERGNFEVWDLLGFVHCALGLEDPRNHEAAMVQAFQEARGIATEPGIVGRVMLYLDQLALVEDLPLIAVARGAAGGAGV